MTTLSALSNTSAGDQLEAALKRLCSGPKKSWSTQRSELIAAHRAENRVFVLGAGISIDYGLPSWTVLL